MSTSLIAACLLLRLLDCSSLSATADERALACPPAPLASPPPPVECISRPEPVTPTKSKVPRTRPAPPHWHTSRDPLPPVLVDSRSRTGSTFDEPRWETRADEPVEAQCDGESDRVDTLSEMSFRHSGRTDVQTLPNASDKRTSPTTSRRVLRTPSISSRRSSISSVRSASGIFPAASTVLAPIVGDHEHVPHRLVSSGENDPAKTTPVLSRACSGRDSAPLNAIPPDKPRLYAGPNRPGPMPNGPGPSPRYTASEAVLSTAETVHLTHGAGNNAAERLRSLSGLVK